LKLARSIAAVLVTVLLAAGCHHGQKEFKPAIDPELLKLSKDQLFEKGEDLFNHKKFARARTYYSFLYENYPNDPLGRRALLRVADTYFQQGDPVNLVEAQYKYRDFVNRYPGSDVGDYAMLQIAMVSFKQMGRPDRDQAKTKEAADKLNEMIKAYPKSKYRPEAEQRLQQASDRLAKHEHLIARFYMKRGQYSAAISRLNGIVENYPNYSGRDATFYDLARSLDAMGRKAEARLYYERVLSEFPQSPYAKEARTRLDQIKV
jgi:outer membrane protein assembly factor BamD